jgi:hypothetical protein
MKMYKRGATAIVAASLLAIISVGCTTTRPVEVNDTWTNSANRSAAAAGRAEDAAKRAEAAAARMEAAVQKIENMAGRTERKTMREMNK